MENIHFGFISVHLSVSLILIPSLLIFQKIRLWVSPEKNEFSGLMKEVHESGLEPI